MNELISVLLPVYNCEKYILEALESVLNQTYKNIEVIVIDDCSTDSTAKLIHTINDNRIRYYKNEKNSGIVYSLNKAIGLSNGRYLARMDGDDICIPNRFERQLKYIKEHPDLIIVSCWFEMFGSVSRIFHYPEENKKILVDLIFGNPLLHPGYFIDKAQWDRYNLKYDESMKLVEDYDIASRVAIYGKTGNVPEVLLKYRVHSSQTTNVYARKQDELGNIVRNRLLSKIGIKLNNYETYIFQTICFKEDNSEINNEIFDKAINIYFMILQKNDEIRFFDVTYLRKRVCEKIHVLNIYGLNNDFISEGEALKIALKISKQSKSIRFIFGYLKHLINYKKG